MEPITTHGMNPQKKKEFNTLITKLNETLEHNQELNTTITEQELNTLTAEFNELKQFNETNGI